MGHTGSRKSPSGGEEAGPPQPHHLSLLHKRLYERNGEVQAGFNTFFENLFRRNLEELEKLRLDGAGGETDLQETACSLQRSVHQVNQLCEGLDKLEGSLVQSSLPP